MGYSPVTVQIRPGRARGRGPFALPVSVASSRTDGPVEGTVTVVPPPGWTADPTERPYRLAPGGYLEFETSVSPAADAPTGRYFVAARITDDAGQVHEDVVTIDLDTGTGSDATFGRSPELDVAERRTARRAAEILGESGRDPGGPAAGSDPADPIGGELEIELLTPELRVRAGEDGELRIALRNGAASEIRGEAQLISPHDTWASFGPWTQGFSVGPGSKQTVTFPFQPPSDMRPGTWWGLVKVMYFGRLWYTEAAEVEVL
jgi:hypothetical protein